MRQFYSGDACHAATLPYTLSIAALGSTLALLVTRVGGTQDAHHALAAHNFAIFADFFY
jgi:hypothetical protein